MEGTGHWQDPDRATIARLLRGPKPGLAAQSRMAPRPRQGWPPGEGITSRQGGVLLLLYPHQGQLYLVLTRRTEAMDNHKGQIALPGGHREGEESIEQTALREAQEELGVVPTAVKVLGTLTPLYIPPSNFCITPVVGWAEKRPDWQPDDVEVAEVRRFIEEWIRFLHAEHEEVFDELRDKKEFTDMLRSKLEQATSEFKERFGG